MPPTLSTHRWVIVTGEYPPAIGGVGDYTRHVATALADRGDEVDVIAPPDSETCGETAVRVHRLPDHFSARALSAMSEIVRSLPRPRTLLLQYVPHAFGARCMNLPLAMWWKAQRTEHRAVMFHEVSSPVDLRHSLKQSVLGCVHHVMGEMLVSSADEVFTSTAAWRPKLLDLGADPSRLTVLPIPSNLPTQVSPEAVATAKASISRDGMQLVGSFGTFGSYVAPLLKVAIEQILQQTQMVRVLVIGRGAGRFAREDLSARWRGSDRVIALEDLPPEEAAVAIAACDVMIQPYPDGVTTRRTSMAAAMALGRACVTNAGRLTEPLWMGNAACVLTHDLAEIPAETIQLLQSDVRRLATGVVAARFYQEQLSLGRVIDIMRARCTRR